MKSTELRIGNLLNPKVNGVIIYEEIHIVEPTTLMILQGDVNGKGIGFEPIPLTEEWLLKFGFDRRKDIFFKFGGYPHTISLNTNGDSYRVEIVCQSIA